MMIPFASSRGSGQDLATHLQNAQDNEFVEIADMRGCISRDLHGAFAEWEFQADTLTRCSNYLYSLSINPDPAQGRLTRAQYLDYIDRTEEALGLAGQPRAVVFHIKGTREHAHVVWSRVNAEEGKAVHLAFDKEKLMGVTRAFAKEHGLELPQGYFKDGKDRGKQATLYDMHQQRETGLTKAERSEAITQAWRQSDTAKAFVAALSDLGYTLAQGRRPYVLVDIYGQTNALPRMINDKQVRAKDVAQFLENEFPSSDLPTVDEAKALAKEHRQAMKSFEDQEKKAADIAALKMRQAERRRDIDLKQSALKLKQEKARVTLRERQLGQRLDLKHRYLEERREVKARRKEHEAKGLTAFLGRVTGVEAVIKKVRSWQDWKKFDLFLEQKVILQERQKDERSQLQRRQELEALGLERQRRGLEKVEIRELKSLESLHTRQANIKARGGDARMPSLALELKPKGRKAAPHKAKDRHKKSLDQVKEAPVSSREPAPRIQETGDIDLVEVFDKASGAADQAGDGKSSGDDKAPKPKSETKIKRYRRRRKPRDHDRGR